MIINDNNYTVNLQLYYQFQMVNEQEAQEGMYTLYWFKLQYIVISNTDSQLSTRTV